MRFNQKSRQFSQLVTALFLGSSLVGCAAVVKTPYQAPAVNIPQQFDHQQKSQQALAQLNTDRWWTLFHDAALNQLVEQVLARNSDLAVAGLNLQQARLQAKQSQSQQGVRIGNAGISTGHQFSLEGNGDAARGISLNYPGLSYELDLFGKLANQTEAARWEALATEQDLQATAQSLIATTANLYWQLGYLNERYVVAQQNLASTQKTYQLVSAQYRAGAVSGLDLNQAEQAW